MGTVRITCPQLENMRGQHLLLPSIIVSYVGGKADTGNADPQKTNQLKNYRPNIFLINHVDPANGLLPG